MLSKSTIRWVDLGYNFAQNHLKNVEKMIFEFDSGSHGTHTKEDRELKRKIKLKLDKAGVATHTPRSEKEVKALVNGSPVFSTAHTIEEITSVPLSATPHELQQTLKKIETQIERHS